MVALVTAVVPRRDVVDLEFDEYVSKPVSRRDLREMVDRLHRRQALESNLNQAYRLASKLGTLEAAMGQRELAQFDEYHRLTERLADTQEEIADHLADLSIEMYKDLMRDVSANG